MSVFIVVAAVLLTGLLAWYFFAPRAAKRATVEGDLQVQTITVRGGYSPSVVEVVQGVRTRLLFDRQETGECSSPRRAAGVQGESELACLRDHRCGVRPG